MTDLLKILGYIVAAVFVACLLGSAAWYGSPRVAARLWRRLRAKRGSR